MNGTVDFEARSCATPRHVARLHMCEVALQDRSSGAQGETRAKAQACLTQRKRSSLCPCRAGRGKDARLGVHAIWTPSACHHAICGGGNQWAQASPRRRGAVDDVFMHCPLSIVHCRREALSKIRPHRENTGQHECVGRHSGYYSQWLLWSSTRQ